MKHFIYLLSRGFFYVFSIFFAFVVIFSLLAFFEYQLVWDVPFVELRNQKTYAFIDVPLIDLGVSFPFNMYSIFVMWIGILFYVIYFYALKEFFRVFIAEKLFNPVALKRLRHFFFINIIPVAYVAVLSIYYIVRDGKLSFNEDQGIAVFHLCIALLVYLYLDIFKTGSEIQEENDLTI